MNRLKSLSMSGDSETPAAPASQTAGAPPNTTGWPDRILQLALGEPASFLQRAGVTS
jgi:hypothetical protein